MVGTMTCKKGKNDILRLKLGQQNCMIWPKEAGLQMKISFGGQQDFSIFWVKNEIINMLIEVFLKNKNWWMRSTTWQLNVTVKIFCLIFDRRINGV